MKAFNTKSAILTLLIVGLAEAEIYTWTDENGKKHFGDKPPVHGAARKVETKNPNIIAPDGNADSAGERSAPVARDAFRMPLRDAKAPYRFVMTSALIEHQPVDQLAEITLNEQRSKFYIHVKFLNVEKGKTYTYRSRVLDANGGLILDKDMSIEADTTSFYAISKITPNVHIDASGQWEFQGILNGRKAYVEKRQVTVKPRAVEY